MFGFDTSKIAEKKIAEIIKKTANENEINETDVRFILKINKGGRVIVIPYWNNETHPSMYIEQLFK